MRRFLGREKQAAEAARFNGIGTVLMSDVIGLAGAFKGLDSEELASIVNQFAIIPAATVEDTSGVLLQFTPDITLAYWRPSCRGLSHAAEAFACGRRILENARRFQTEHNVSLGLRIALGTGDMTVDFIGRRLRAVGRACITARRLLDLNLPRKSAMLYTPETLQHIPDAILPPHAVARIQRSTGETVDVYEFVVTDD